jgi:hypothetical protein
MLRLGWSSYDGDWEIEELIAFSMMWLGKPSYAPLVLCDLVKEIIHGLLIFQTGEVKQHESTGSQALCSDRAGNF